MYDKLDKVLLSEATRNQLIAQSRNADMYKNTKFGKNRFERKRLSKVANQVKLYNQIDMNQFFKQDTIEIKVPVQGETDSYTVSIQIEGIVTEIAKNIKSNNNKLEFRTIIQSLTKLFNSANIKVKCTCKDYLFHYDHWLIISGDSVNDSSADPGPGTRGLDPKGKGCKHILLVLSNQDFLMKVASVINNYINYMAKNKKQAFLKVMFPKLYGIPASAAEEDGLIPEDTELETTPNIIDTINTFGKNRGKYTAGSNKNPVTGTGGRVKKAQAESGGH